MEFGRIEQPALLDQIDFTLPPDPAGTDHVLKTQRRSKQPKIFVGCAKWGRKDWIDKIYPKGTKDKDFLEAYGKQFNCIEFNAIFYKLPSHQQVRDWKSKVGRDFLFCPKFTDVVTHIKRLKNAKHETDLFLDVLSEFDQNLGPLFLMPHPQMGPQHYDTIRAYLESLPRDLDLYLELRHPAWYVDDNLQQVLALCKDLNIGMVITDSAGRRDCVHMELTKPGAFIRFVGNSLHPSDYNRIDEWVGRIQSWINKGIHEIYFFMHQHDELYSPELIRYLVDELNTRCKLNLSPPVFVNEKPKQQPSLF